jgi:alkyl hydroperoxide reductase subunit AhpF
MAFFSADDTKELSEIFGGLTRDVQIALVTDEAELIALIDELAAAAPAGRIAVEKIGESGDPDRLRALGVARTPAMALSSAGASGKLLFYGHPVGYEMATFVAALLDLGAAPGAAPPLAAETQAVLGALAKDVHIQVFSTPG